MVEIEATKGSTNDKSCGSFITKFTIRNSYEPRSKFMTAISTVYLTSLRINILTLWVAEMPSRLIIILLQSGLRNPCESLIPLRLYSPPLIWLSWAFHSEAFTTVMNCRSLCRFNIHHWSDFLVHFVVKLPQLLWVVDPFAASISTVDLNSLWMNTFCIMDCVLWV